MTVNIVVPALGESVVEATVARWLRKEGDAVAAGETLVELETDKVNLEVGAEKAGVLARIERKEGEDVKVGDLLGTLEDGPASTAQPSAPQSSQPAAQPKPSDSAPAPQKEAAAEPSSMAVRAKATPSARKLAQDLGIAIEQVTGSGAGNQVTLQDVQSHAQKQKAPASEPPPPTSPSAAATPVLAPEGREERIKMSRRRQTIAKRLVEAQHNAAMLTTYNEVDMTAIMELRKKHKEPFQKRYGIGLGIMSFFIKASIGALKAFPAVNAEIQGNEMVFKKYYDIGIAIGAAEGLVVPVLRDAGQMSFAGIERAIKAFIQKSDEGTLSLEDLRGGTFTITNGGVFGSLMSTPILNPPQVAILGMHKIEERPIAFNGQVVIRPMMYVALSYDHRIVDGRESVQFLAKIKTLVEEPSALLLEE